MVDLVSRGQGRLLLGTELVVGRDLAAWKASCVRLSGNGRRPVAAAAMRTPQIMGQNLQQHDAGDLRCWERVSCPRFVAHDLSGMFLPCSGGGPWFGRIFCGVRS